MGGNRSLLRIDGFPLSIFDFQHGNFRRLTNAESSQFRWPSRAVWRHSPSPFRSLDSARIPAPSASPSSSAGRTPGRRGCRGGRRWKRRRDAGLDRAPLRATSKFKLCSPWPTSISTPDSLASRTCGQSLPLPSSKPPGCTVNIWVTISPARRYLSTSPTCDRRAVFGPALADVNEQGEFSVHRRACARAPSGFSPWVPARRRWP